MSETYTHLSWHNCYKQGWGKEIVPEAYGHPAKFARGLIRRIYEHALEQGYLKEGQTVIDPFGGVALGAADALANGLHFVGVELEQNFVDMGAGCDCTGISEADWVRCFGRWKRFAHLDGRHWCPRCLAEAGGVIEPGPPSLPGMEPDPTASYERNSGKIPHTEPHRYAGNLDLFARHARDGATAVLVQGDSRNLVEVLEGLPVCRQGARAEGLISSPPWMNSQEGASVAGPSSGMWKGYESGFRPKPGGKIYASSEEAYGTDPAQLGNMPTGEPPQVDGLVSSPPFADSQQSRDAGFELDSTKANPTPRKLADRSYFPAEMGSDGQLAVLPEGEPPQVDGLVSSPPWEKSLNSTDLDFIHNRLTTGPSGSTKLRGIKGAKSDGQIYGDAAGQLGQESGDTFWSAAKTILDQCYAVLAPGGVAIFVCKRFVRDKKIVEFSQQWADLCQPCGFELIEWIKAWLVEERGTQYDLEGETHTKTVKRFSFFRRLHAQKYPHLAIDWEDVLIFRKAA